MNPLFDRECSSGCESGWTLYFENDDDNSFLSPKSDKEGSKQDEEEDLSMVSDASSGPPHSCDDNGCYGNEFNNNRFFVPIPSDVQLPKNNGKRKKNNEHRRQKVQEQLSCLDDTASSSISNFSSNKLAISNNQASADNILEFSQAHSSTKFEDKPRFQERYTFFKSPAVSGTKLQQNQSPYRWFDRKKVGMR